MTIEQADTLIVVPTLAYMGAPYNSDEARVLLLAIGYQESRFATRKQEKGPARGFWQFEGGPKTAGAAFCRDPRFAPFRAFASELHYPVTMPGFMRALASGGDKLACIAARGLLFLDPRPLPARGQVQEAWGYYKRNWNPGKPHLATWRESYRLASDCVWPPAAD
jgi:hypothetical protein